LAQKTKCIKCLLTGETADTCWIMFPERAAATELSFALKDTISTCMKCPAFDEALSRSTGRRESDKLLTMTLRKLMGQLVDYDIELSSITNSLQKRIEELAVLKSVSEALLRTPDLRKVMLITLIGITSSEAFGFDHAMVFLVNDVTKTLDGQIGMGHTDFEKSNLSESSYYSDKISYNDFIDQVLSEENIPKSSLTEFAEKISIPLRPGNCILLQAIREKKSFVVDRASEDVLIDKQLVSLLESTSFAVIPLISEGRVLGVILADNMHSTRPISDSDITTLETLANQSASKIENALLQNQLEVRIAELEHMHQLLQKNQEYLVKSEKLVDLGMLASTVAHEVKTPLVAIGGYAHRVLKNIDKGEFNRKDVEIICDEIMRLERICVEILEYSHKSSLDLQIKDLNKIIFDTLSMELNQFKYHNITFKTYFSSEELKVYADSDRLKQVLYNLIQNAAEALPDGGVIRIITGRQNDYAFFQIQDDGCGMDETTIHKSFKPFFTSKRMGTGLGLSVSKKIIDDHGGTIKVTSNPAKGSTFTINLPMNVRLNIRE
jgi:signal transduction histidine kinase